MATSVIEKCGCAAMIPKQGAPKDHGGVSWAPDKGVINGIGTGILAPKDNAA